MGEASERRPDETGARGMDMANREGRQHPWRSENPQQGSRSLKVSGEGHRGSASPQQDRMDTEDLGPGPHSSTKKPPTSVPQFPYPLNESDSNTFLLRVVPSLQETAEVNVLHR